MIDQGLIEVFLVPGRWVVDFALALLAVEAGVLAPGVYRLLCVFCAGYGWALAGRVVWRGVARLTGLEAREGRR